MNSFSNQSYQSLSTLPTWTSLLVGGGGRGPMRRGDNTGLRLDSSAQRPQAGLPQSETSTRPPIPSSHAITDFYDHFFRDYATTPEDDVRRSVISRFARPDGRSRILEIGAGGGVLTETLADKARTIALDLAMYPDLSKVLRRTKTLSFVVGTAAKLPFRDSYFDIVVCSEVLEHLPRFQRGDVLTEIARVLKPIG